MDKIIFFTALVLFPFGQIFKFGIFNAFDIAILLLALITLLKKPKYPKWYRYFVYFILSCIFGLILNSSLLSLNSILYLVRLWTYSMISVYISNYQNNKLLTINSSLLIVACASAMFGWFQYLIWPDLTSLKYLGWDDHLFRMIGTFLDPTYLGLILVLGAIIALNKKLNLAFYFLAFSILFTYSRVSYFLLFLITILNKKYIALIFFIFIILVVPKNIGEGTNLTRTASGSSKLINYSETWQIFNKSPVYGVGFNNICAARQKYLGDINIDSHACNGADSSFLFILATTGIIGFMLLLNALGHMPYGILLTASFAAVLLHSFFANSLFYPHILFWMFGLVGLKTKSDR